MLDFKLKSIIRDVPDFPKPGILFKDITPLYTSPILLKECIVEIQHQFKGYKIDAIAGIEARGFLTGILLAEAMGLPFIPIRKAGKLPYHKISKSYELEYGSATIEMHKDALHKGDKVLIHDDLLATGGSAEAAANLVTQTEADVIGFSFIIDLPFLGGNERLKKSGKVIHSLVSYNN